MQSAGGKVVTKMRTTGHGADACLSTYAGGMMAFTLKLKRLRVKYNIYWSPDLLSVA